MWRWPHGPLQQTLVARAAAHTCRGQVVASSHSAPAAAAVRAEAATTKRPRTRDVLQGFSWQRTPAEAGVRAHHAVAPGGAGHDGGAPFGAAGMATPIELKNVAIAPAAARRRARQLTVRAWGAPPTKRDVPSRASLFSLLGAVAAGAASEPCYGAVPSPWHLDLLDRASVSRSACGIEDHSGACRREGSDPESSTRPGARPRTLEAVQRVGIDITLATVGVVPVDHCRLLQVDVVAIVRASGEPTW